MNKLTHHGLAGGLGALLFVLAGTAWAQTTTPPEGQDTMGQMQHDRDDMSGMKGMHEHAKGMHTMPATVNSVDQTTGMVEATAEGMTLKVHFPPSALADLKAGDHITLHMGYSKP